MVQIQLELQIMLENANETKGLVATKWICTGKYLSLVYLFISYSVKSNEFFGITLKQSYNFLYA